MTLVAFGAGLVLQRFAWPFSARTASEPQKVPFLGGGEPQTHAWQRYHVRYYPMTLLFVAFEMEMMFMYPWAVVYVAEGVMALAEMGMFLAILAIGIVYGWREGAFRWQ
ncbi:MAG: NADH-quinone oxidoreductase subunit A [Halofilum sp. (in: g-proteobacteria)]